MKHSSYGLLYGSDIHHLDHIAVMCSILDIPLVLTNPEIVKLAKETYPNLETIHVELHQLAEILTPKAEIIFSCLPTQLLDPIFSFEEHKLKKKLLYIFLPHGLSDKDNLEALKSEKFLLSYGKLMQDILSKKGVLEKVNYSALIGNFRKNYYLENQAHFDKFIAPYITFKNPNAKTIFYAPTWGGSDLQENSFTLISSLPQKHNLIVKFHPNSLNTGFALGLREAFGDKDNIKFVDEISPIYPLLAHCDIYVGDHSSIAYDFLFFDKPMYFFSKSKTPIHLTGETITPTEFYTKIDEQNQNYQEARKSLYEYAFEPSPSIKNLRKLIADGIEDYYDKEPHVL